MEEISLSSESQSVEPAELRLENTETQGIDGSARKPALRQDTCYMVEKTYHGIAPYLGAFGAYLMPQ